MCSVRSDTTGTSLTWSGSWCSASFTSGCCHDDEFANDIGTLVLALAGMGDRPPRDVHLHVGGSNTAGHAAPNYVLRDRGPHVSPGPRSSTCRPGQPVLV